MAIQFHFPNILGAPVDALLWATFLMPFAEMRKALETN